MSAAIAARMAGSAVSTIAAVLAHAKARARRRQTEPASTVRPADTVARRWDPLHQTMAGVSRVRIRGGPRRDRVANMQERPNRWSVLRRTIQP